MRRINVRQSLPILVLALAPMLPTAHCLSAQELVKVRLYARSGPPWWSEVTASISNRVTTKYWPYFTNLKTRKPER